MKNLRPADTPKQVKKLETEIRKIDQKEAEAVENFQKKAQEAINIIQENHFHLRLWKAIGGKS